MGWCEHTGGVRTPPSAAHVTIVRFAYASERAGEKAVSPTYAAMAHCGTYGRRTVPGMGLAWKTLPRCSEWYL